MRHWSWTLPALLGAVAGCTAGRGADLPPFVTELIAQHAAGPVSNPPAAIWRYEYRGRVVYYVPPSCCDVPSTLYDTTGAVICGPDGGITGKGDGRCADFFEQRTEELLVWSDPRGRGARTTP